MAVPPNALKKWEKVRDRAPGLPEAAEDHPWGDMVAKVGENVSVLLGSVDGGHREAHGRDGARPRDDLPGRRARRVRTGEGRLGARPVEPQGAPAAP